MMNIATPPAKLRGYSEEEWKIRCDLAALYRLVAHFRMTDLIYTHISARLPGDEHHFLINKYGVMFHEMRASDLVRIDLDGNVLEDDATSKPVNAAGFTIHSAIHSARHDANYVIHTHTAAGMAVSAQKQGLLPLNQHSLKFYGHLAYHTYEGIALDLEERERLVNDLGTHNAMILRNHGLLTCGSTAAAAWDQLYYLERSCQAQIDTLSGGCELHLPSEAVRVHTANQFNRPRKPGEPGPGELAWTACLRLIENDSIDYRS